MATSTLLLCTVLIVSLALCTSSLLPSHSSDMTKWQDLQDNSLVKREVKTWKKGPPPGWWYHTNGHPEGKRFITSPKDILRKDVQADRLMEDFLLFLRLKDTDMFDEFTGRR